jgi:hypothetical protein
LVERYREYYPFVLLCAAVLAFVLLAPMARYGDASDYVFFAESLWYDQDLRHTPEDLARHLQIKPPFFDSPAGLHTREGRGGREYYGAHHSFYYSLAALPFYGLLGYRGFFVFNGVCFCLFALLLYWHLRRSNGPVSAWSWLGLGTVFSASWSYIPWIHTEVFYMALLGLFMYAWQRGRPLGAAAALGYVATAQPILALLAGPFFLLSWQERRSWRTLLAMAALIGAIAAPQVIFNLWAFGTPHPLLAIDVVGTQHLRLGNFIRSWIDPAAGILWFYPAVLAAVFEAPKNRLTAWMVAASLAVILASGVSQVWYSHQVGLRYGSYVFPLLLFTVRGVSFRTWRSLAVWSFVVLVGTGLVLNPIGNSVTMDITGKLFLPYRLAKRLPWYPEDGAVLWNRLQKPGGVVGTDWVYEDGWLPGDRPVKMLLTLAHTGPLELRLGPWAAAMGRPQKLTVRTDSGKLHRYELAPGEVARLQVPLAAEDLWPTGPDTGWCLLELRAEGWTPQLVMPGSADSRRLGAWLLRISQRGRVLYERPGA